MYPVDPKDGRKPDAPHLIAVIIGASIGALTLLLYFPSWRPYWYIIMIGGAAAGVLAFNLLDLNDRITARRKPGDNTNAAVFQSCLLAILIFGIVFALCIVGVFFVSHK